MKTKFILPMILLASACGADDGPAPSNEIGVEACTGAKCDGISDKFKDAFDDMKSIELDDLKVVGAGLATEELNGALGDIPFSTISISETALYGDQAEVLGQTTVHPLSEVSAGLTSRLGSEAFATRINAIRQAEVSAKDVVYAESHFEIGPDLSHDWGVDHGDAVGSVGFLAQAKIESIVIAPFDDKSEAIVDNPLQALKNTRGWVIPRDISDIGSMAPGESMTMRADGALGFNLGVGVPFLIANVGSAVTLNARVSFGAKASLEGKLDVQLVRGDGNQAFIDVGLENAKRRHFSVVGKTGFGVSGLPEVDLDLGVANVDITKVAEKALTKQLDKYINAQAELSRSKAETRLTVARFRVTLNEVDGDAEQAINQALRGDIRFAQALANRDHPALVQELDLSRNARSEANFIGFRFLGMEFYRASNFDTGVVTIERDGTNQTLLFNEIENKSGFFFTDRDMAWRTLVSLESKDGKLTDA